MLILLLVLTICALLIPEFFYLRKALLVALKTRSLKPTPDELAYFPYREIQASNPTEWEKHEAYPSLFLSEKSREFLKDLDTISFLIIYQGRLLHEQYTPPFHAAYPTNSFSVAKSVLSALAGIAVSEGMISLDSKLTDHLNEKFYPAIKHLTLRDVLCMSTGLDWNESERSPFSSNAKAYYGTNLKALIREMRYKMHPGIAFEYLSGNSLLLSLLLRKVAGMPLTNFVEKNLWGPLQAEHKSYWLLDKDRGLEKSFCCFYAIPRDLARIGQLFLNKGTWNGKRLISEKFIDEAIRPSQLYDQVLRRKQDRYGYHWWTAELDDHPAFYARGISGQYIICLPHLDVVIVRTGFRREKPDSTGHPPDLFRYPLLAKELIAQV